MMAEPSESMAPKIAEISAQLSADPVEASAEILTVAAVVCASAGYADEQVMRGLRAALDDVRAGMRAEGMH